jgi:hypothetical protein
MQPRTTGLLLLAAAALGAFVYFYEIRGQEGRQAAEEREKRLFPEVEAEGVAWVAFTTSDGRRVRGERADGGWRLTEPLPFPGDDFAWDSIASVLSEISSETVYQEPQPPAVYGLDDASREVRFGVEGTQHALRTGNRVPVGSGSYAAVVGRDPVFTVPSFRLNAFRKTLDELREKRMLDFDPASVRRVVASWPEGRVELERGDEAWRLTFPVDGPADGDSVEDLLSDLSFLRAKGFEDEPADDAATGLDAPAFAVELELEAAEGAEPRRLTFAVSGLTDGDDRLVRAGEPSLYRIADERLEDFPRDVVAYRFKRLADYASEAAARVELGFSGLEGESLAVTARRGEGGWESSTEPVPAEKLARLVDELSRLEASNILAERVGVDELAELGLDPPRATLLVYAGPEAESADAAPLAELRIGAQRDGGGFVVQTAEDPMLFELDAAQAEHVPVSLEAFRNRFVAEEQADAAPPAPDAEREATLPETLP